jgi:hypothetical protein
MSEVQHHTDWRWQPANKFGGVKTRRPRAELTRIGMHLRTLYDQVVEEPVPNRLTRLLARIEEHRA